MLAVTWRCKQASHLFLSPRSAPISPPLHDKCSCQGCAILTRLRLFRNICSSFTLIIRITPQFTPDTSDILQLVTSNEPKSIDYCHKVSLISRCFCLGLNTELTCCQSLTPSGTVTCVERWQKTNRDASSVWLLSLATASAASSVTQ